MSDTVTGNLTVFFSQSQDAIPEYTVHGIPRKVLDKNTYHQRGEHDCFLESHCFRFRVCVRLRFHELRACLNGSDKWLNYARSRVIYIRAVPFMFEPSDLLTQVYRGRLTCHRQMAGQILWRWRSCLWSPWYSFVHGVRERNLSTRNSNYRHSFYLFVLFLFADFHPRIHIAGPATIHIVWRNRNRRKTLACVTSKTIFAMLFFHWKSFFFFCFFTIKIADSIITAIRPNIDRQRNFINRSEVRSMYIIDFLNASSF